MKFKCSRSMEYLEIFNRGDVWLCCPNNTTRPLGNVFTDDVMTLWKGPRAEKIRLSIANGDFSLCTRCSYLPAPCGPIQSTDDSSPPEPPARIDRLFIAFDRSCHLRCPSCRDTIVLNDDRYHVKRLYTWLTDSGVLAHVNWLRMLSSGDPMSSKLCQETLRRIQWERYPLLKLHFQTNGIQFTPENYQSMTPETRDRLKSISVSIDAATSKTYLLNRSRGNLAAWKILQENLQLISSLKQQGVFQYYVHVMVLQANNFREMAEFSEKAFACGAQAEFMQLNNWGTYSAAEYAARAVHFPDHPDHEEYLRTRNLSIFSDPRIIKFWP